MRVAIVILNWNGIKYLQKFLPILINETNKEISEIIIADNGSTDESISWLTSNFQHLKPIILDQIYGFP